MHFFFTESKNVVQLESKWSRPIIVPEFSPNGDLTLIRFENATRRVKAQKKIRTNQTQVDLPTVPKPIAEYMADIMNEIPKNKSKNDREKLIIENLFIEILRDDQLKNQLTEVISNVTKNVISKTDIKIGTDDLISRGNRTGNAPKSENSSNGKRNKSSSKSESTTILVPTTERFREDGITKVEFIDLNKYRGNKKTVSKFEIWDDDDDDEEDEDENNTDKAETRDIIKTKNRKQEEVDKETDENTTTLRNDIDDDDGVTVETEESDSTTVSVETTTTVTKSTITPTTTTTTEKPTNKKNTNDKSRNTNRRKKPTKTKLNLENLDERGKKVYVYFIIMYLIRMKMKLGI